MIEGRREDTDEGVPQGSFLSPLLANVYLHYVLDQWFQREVQPRLSGQAYIVRYADDFICAFESESDAKRFQEVLAQATGPVLVGASRGEDEVAAFRAFCRTRLPACWAKGLRARSTSSVSRITAATAAQASSS